MGIGENDDLGGIFTDLSLSVQKAAHLPHSTIELRHRYE
jgi:hypothetical protein